MSKIEYPKTHEEPVSEDYHGTTIVDNYKWMESPDSELTQNFVKVQNELSFPYLKNQCPAQPKFEKKLTELFNYPKYGTTFKKGPNYFYRMNTGLQNQSVLYKQKSLSDEGEVFLDPNTFSTDGTVSMGGMSFTKDGSLMAYGTSKSGSDWVTIKFKNVETGEELPDKLERVKFSCMSWTHDNKGIFYNAFIEQEGKTDGTETTSNVHQKLLYHRLGEDQSKDVIFAEFPDNPKWMSGCEVTNDGKYLILYVREGCENVNRLWYAKMEPLIENNMKSKPEWCKLIDNFDAEYDVICNDGSVFTLSTNLKAPRSKLIRIDFENPAMENWETIVEEHEKDVLEMSMAINNNLLVLCYLKDVKNVLQIHDLHTGKFVKNIDVEIGSIHGCSGKREMTEMFFQVTSFTTPGVLHRYDFEKEELSVLRKTEVKGINTDEFTTSQHFYTSNDGTKVPMFIVHKKDIQLDGSHPCLLYGYGGFNISITPSFSVSKLMFLKHLGGVFCVANIRGGGEYGETWHKAGTKLNKQNVFDDFKSAAKYLVDNKWTQAKKLAINGGSNGGLLVAACANQNPELFGCAVAQVGVMDMLNFHKFTIGHAWTTDYGSSDDKKYFEYLHKYSPVHNVPTSGYFPSLLLLTGDHDDRVVPHHSLKYAAHVQKNLGAAGENPMLIRVDTKSGHGAGKPTSKVIEECADVYGFIAKSVGAEWKD